VFNELNVSKAQAARTEDLDRILNSIRGTHGVMQMTHDLKDALVKVRHVYRSARGRGLLWPAASVKHCRSLYVVSHYSIPAPCQTWRG
jgi:hypothetical protein